MIQSKHIWSSEENVIERHHGTRCIQATVAKISTAVVPTKANVNEVNRQQIARNKLIEEQQLMAGKSMIYDNDDNDKNDTDQDIDIFDEEQ